MLRAHSREEIPCKIAPIDASEATAGVSKEQEKHLRSRKRPAGQTEVDRWKDMYRILFPDDREDSIPSPC
jgi:hypothetical protein